MNDTNCPKKPTVRKILGVDPGTIITGYGVIAVHERFYEPLDFGCIRPPPHYPLSERYLAIFEGIDELIEQHQPSELVVETQFVQKNIQSALKLGMARGVVMTAAKKRGLKVYGYSPSEVKKAVVGNGRASKIQVQGMIQKLLKLSSIPEPEDAADALALIIRHSHSPLHLLVKHEI